jgi:hypothetical protein
MIDNKSAADFYLLITCLNAACYAITEMEPDKMKGNDKVNFKNLRCNLLNFLKGLERRTTKEKFEELKQYNFDNVVLMTELMATMSLLPPGQVDWFLGEVNKLTFAAVNRALSEK